MSLLLFCRLYFTD